MPYRRPEGPRADVARGPEGHRGAGGHRRLRSWTARRRATPSSFMGKEKVEGTRRLQAEGHPEERRRPLRLPGRRSLPGAQGGGQAHHPRQRDGGGERESATTRRSAASSCPTPSQQGAKGKPQRQTITIDKIELDPRSTTPASRCPRRSQAVRGATVPAGSAALVSSPGRALAAPAPGAQDVKIDSDTFGGLEARSIGPAAMSGRIAALDAVEGDRLTIYVGAAGGGVWKSKDGGLQFKPVFDKHTQSIGAVAIDPKDPKTVWVGTGEILGPQQRLRGRRRLQDHGRRRQLAAPGPREHRAHRAHRDRPQGHRHRLRLRHRAAFATIAERGVFRTRDGGKTWEKVLFVERRHGLRRPRHRPPGRAHPVRGMWQFRRQGLDFFTSGGPGSGLYKSTDGGSTWKKIHKGLPKADLGRIAVAVVARAPERRLRDRRGEGRDRALPLRRPGRDLDEGATTRARSPAGPSTSPTSWWTPRTRTASTSPGSCWR